MFTQISTNYTLLKTNLRIHFWQSFQEWNEIDPFPKSPSTRWASRIWLGWILRRDNPCESTWCSTEIILFWRKIQSLDWKELCCWRYEWPDLQANLILMDSYKNNTSLESESYTVIKGRFATFIVHSTINNSTMYLNHSSKIPIDTTLCANKWLDLFKILLNHKTTFLAYTNNQTNISIRRLHKVNGSNSRDIVSFG